MNLKSILIAFAALTLMGCSSMGSKVGSSVKDIDPESEELKRLGAGAMVYEDTPPFMRIADKYGVMVFAEKNLRTFQTNDPGIRQARWDIRVMNEKPIGRCLSISFRLMDFEYIADHPTEFYVPPNRSVLAGVMLQKVWDIGGVKFVPPSSGYVSGMRVRDPIIGAKRGEECDFAEEDAMEDDDYISFSLF